ncbi:hypothetical protein [Mesorhizobium sp. A623]
MMTMSLNDGPVILSNVGVLISTTSDILHEIDRDKVTPDVWAEISRVQSLLSIACDTCEQSVQAIEAGPDFAHGGAE